jgi:hypothetical protein
MELNRAGVGEALLSHSEEPRRNNNEVAKPRQHHMNFTLQQWGEELNFALGAVNLRRRVGRFIKESE